MLPAWDGFYLCLGKIVAYVVIALLFVMILGGRGEPEDDED